MCLKHLNEVEGGEAKTGKKYSVQLNQEGDV